MNQVAKQIASAVVILFLGWEGQTASAADFVDSSAASAAARQAEDCAKRGQAQYDQLQQRIAQREQDLWARRHKGPEVGKLRSRLAEAKAKANSLWWEKQAAISELRQGLFCSQCMRVASEIEKTGVNFWRHLKEVNGKPIPATQEQIDKKAAEFDRKIEQSSREANQARKEIAQEYDRFDRAIKFAESDIAQGHLDKWKIRQQQWDCENKARAAHREAEVLKAREAALAEAEEKAKKEAAQRKAEELAEKKRQEQEKEAQLRKQLEEERLWADIARDFAEQAKARDEAARAAQLQQEYEERQREIERLERAREQAEASSRQMAESVRQAEQEAARFPEPATEMPSLFDPPPSRHSVDVPSIFPGPSTGQDDSVQRSLLPSLSLGEDRWQAIEERASAFMDRARELSEQARAQLGDLAASGKEHLREMINEKIQEEAEALFEPHFEDFAPGGRSPFGDMVEEKYSSSMQKLVNRVNPSGRLGFVTDYIIGKVAEKLEEKTRHYVIDRGNEYMFGTTGEDEMDREFYRTASPINLWWQTFPARGIWALPGIYNYGSDLVDFLDRQLSRATRGLQNDE